MLADSLGKATVNLRVYFWLNGREHSWLKVRSSVIRLVKLAFQQHGISMPDEAREVVFPQGVPVTMLDRRPEGTHDASRRSVRPQSSAEELDVGIDESGRRFVQRSGRHQGTGSRSQATERGPESANGSSRVPRIRAAAF